MRCRSQLVFGSEHMRNDCVRVAMTQPMLAFQPSDNFHMLHVPDLSNKLKPVANGVAVLLLDGMARLQILQLIQTQDRFGWMSYKNIL